MTIGIAARGPNAGLAVFRALRAVERVATGCIGGFVSYAAVDASGQLLRASTQRGGTRTLFVLDEHTGVEPPIQAAGAPLAALMSSGPDRPEPLSQFVAGDTAGLVTGHRFAHGIGARGLAFNQDALARMTDGASAVEAVAAVIAENPSSDVGLVGIAAGGEPGIGNSERVAERGDLGEAVRYPEDAVVAVLHNAIHPVAGIAEMAAEIALEVMCPAQAAEFRVEARAGTRVVAGARSVLRVDAALRVIEIVTTDPSLVGGCRDGAPAYAGTDIVQDGTVIGQTVFEPYVVLRDGRVESLVGQRSLWIACRRPRALTGPTPARR